MGTINIDKCKKDAKGNWWCYDPIADLFYKVELKNVKVEQIPSELVHALMKDNAE